MLGTLYVVATPIGNLEDITHRAVRVLASVDLVAAEDTRHSRRLLDHLGIETALTSYHDHAEREKAPQLVDRLRSGSDVALICDAGTPGMSDPGYRLVCAAIEAGVRVVPIPGPSAVTACLSVSGLPTDRFAFEGFVPAKTGARVRFYQRLSGERRTIVCFEAGRRLVASLADLERVLGRRRIVVGREVTKIYEDFRRGTVDEVAAGLSGAAVRGEVTLMIAGADAAHRAEPQEVSRRVAELRGQGVGMKEVARRVAAETGWSAREVYEIGILGSDET
jgi:16S rRNA (cytidine1402-2'-O)-methyltransferase